MVPPDASPFPPASPPGAPAVPPVPAGAPAPGGPGVGAPGARLAPGASPAADGPGAAGAPVGPAAPEWDAERIFPLIADPARRRVLAILAREGPQSVTELARKAGRKAPAMQKHLQALGHEGLAVATRRDSGDRRKQLYALGARVRPETQAGRLVIDFGFCLLRL